jgi:hypothetical protein
MIIKDIQLTNDHGTAVLSAKCKIRKIGWDTVYFSTPVENAQYLYVDASAFAAALFIPSMRQGEDLIIKGTVSKQLVEGMDKIADIMLTWNVNLKRINVKADHVTSDKHQPTKTATFFSGGVDSFYTYLKHKNDTEPMGQVNTFLLVNGFDIDLRSKALWDETVKNVSAVAATEGVELITIESNIQKLLEPILSWDFAHGGCLAAVGLLLRNGFGRIYIPASFSAETQVPWGTHMDLDHFWSTEATKFIHDGTEASRVDKVRWQVAKSPTALKHLRVCYMNEIGEYNCGICPKCLRTMCNLYAARALKEAVTFPDEIDIERLAAVQIPVNEGVQITAGEYDNMAALREQHIGAEVIDAIERSLEYSFNRKPTAREKLAASVQKTYNRIMQLDHLYLHGYTYRGLSSLFGRKFS